MNTNPFAALDEDKKEEEEVAVEVVQKYAYVMLVMGGKKYIPGAIACATSIRKSGTNADIVCLVNGVNDDHIRFLETVFTKVVQIPLLTFATKELGEKQASMYPWNSIAYTKWQSLTLIEYDKVLFIDADTIVLESLDHIFELKCPAATFSSPWAKQFDKNGEFDISYQAVAHGQPIMPEEILEAFESRGYAFIASLVLLEPSMKVYDELINMVKSMEPFGFDMCSTADEQSLAYYYAKAGTQWSHIHPRYNFIIHKPKWIKKQVPHMLHYFKSTKPWMIGIDEDGDDIEQLWFDTPWNTDNIWWFYFKCWITSTKVSKEDLSKILDFKRLDEIYECDDFDFKLTGIDRKYFPWIRKIQWPR